MDTRGMVGRIYKEDHYTLLHTKYGSSGPCGFKEEDFLCLFHCKSMGANDPQGGAISDITGCTGCPVHFGTKYVFWASKNRKFMSIV